MTITFSNFLSELTVNLPLLITAILTMAVIFVNGWTDAPNAIATMVSTRAMNVDRAIIMAAIFNFFGVLVMTLINANVAETLYNMVDFGDDASKALVGLSAALFAIVLWATAAWYFGIPTSESHALIAGISGAAIAIQGSLEGINGSEWIKVIYGLFMSTLLGFGLGYIVVVLVKYIFNKIDRRKTLDFFQNGQIFGGAAMAFMHGAQDGQKFMGVFLLGIFLSKGQAHVSNFQIPIWLMILCSLLMGIGTSIGGKKIIKSVGMDMVKMEKYEGFSADVGAAICLLISSLRGIPVSTTHVKTTAIMGVGASKRIRNVNWEVVKEMILTWVLTFPGCGLIGFIMARIFMKLF
ncbi:MAG: inorganic phosphate transporter [Lagierella massiliensis]|nr:inorganic phosphate transporter [Lagierella massiliensis]